MSLFHVDRYEGEDEEPEEEKAENHFLALIRQITERKKQKAAAKAAAKALEEKSKEESKEESIEEPVKKKKKNKTKDESIKCNENEDEQEVKIEDQDIKNEDIKETNISLKDEETPTESTPENVQETSEPSKDPVKPAECGFTILSTGKKFKNKSVRRVLPRWLAQPNIISSDLNSGPSFEENDCGLDPIFISALKSNGLNRLFPVQTNVIPFLLKCNEDRKRGAWVRDTCICAPTGSGKTLVYVLPILQILKDRFVRRIRCLIVLPVNELAAQVYKVLQTYAASTKLDIGLISSACSFEEEQKKIIRKRSNGEFVSLVDILVATHGRLVDHIEKTEGFSLEHLQFLVIDEADRATDWLEHIPAPHSKPPPLTLQNLNSSSIPPVQKILLSATLSQDPEKISRLGLFRPILFTTVNFSTDEDIDLDKLKEETMTRFTIPETLGVRLIECPAVYKPLAVFHILSQKERVEKTLVFTNSGTSAYRLCILLKILFRDKNIAVKELSSQLTPKQREDTLKQFAANQFHILVSSDALARGLDIPKVTMVISYDPPKYIKGYIHRIGRTGRAGMSGTAVSIITPGQREHFTQMLKSSNMPVPETETDDFDELADTYDYSSQLEKLRQKLIGNKIKVSKLKNGKARKRKHST